MEDNKVKANVRITREQDNKIRELSIVNSLTYSHMFRNIIDIGIIRYENIKRRK